MASFWKFKQAGHLATIVVSLFMSTAHAAPVTFRFEAVVNPLPAFNVDVGLPIELTEGSQISGMLTFDAGLNNDPFGNSSTSIQFFSINFAFNGYIFGSDAYQTRAINDSVILDGPNAGPADSLILECSTSVNAVGCSPAAVDLPTPQPLNFFMRIHLSGRSFDPDIPLAEPQLPEDVDSWNAFQLNRELRFGFFDAAGNSALYTAAIGNFYTVPEPTNLLFVLLTYLAGLSSFRRVPR